MNFSFTTSQEALRARVEAFCKQHCTEAHAEALDRTAAYPKELHAALAESGLLGHCLPEAYGGGGGSAVDLCILAENLGRHSSAATSLLFVNGVSAALVGFGGTEAQKADLIAGVIRGTRRLAFALTEPGAGLDASSIATRAVREGNDYVIDGTKLFTTGAREADFILTVARTKTEGRASQGSSLLVVPTGAAGLTVTPLDKIAGNAIASCRVEYHGVRVPRSSLLGEENHAWSALSLGGGLERLTVAASSLGAAEAAFDEIRAHVTTRVQFGQPVSRFQVVQHQLADLATGIEAARWLTYHAAWMVAEGMMPAKEVSMAKVYAVERLSEVVAAGMRLLGGQAYLRDVAMERRMREAMLSLYAGGTVEIQRNAIARELRL